MKPFKFKQFSVEQKRSAMKIGTDGILLGAWTPIPENCQSILDVGTGTGVIAIQMAQRSDALLIDAVEIDPDAFEECVENFERSPWGDRLFCYHASFEEFAGEIDEDYQLIITNPPFHTADVTPENPSRKAARSANSLLPHSLFQGAAKLLTPEGTLAMIYPFQEEEQLLNTAGEHGLFLQQVCRVQGKENGPVLRSLLLFGRQERPITESGLAIRKADQSYTHQYTELVADFYLKM